MANYWAITIGINQYRHLQPLMHAQNDALFMHRFFTETAGIPAENCVLLSDLATSVGHQVVYPDKPALSEWVQTITQQANADDVLWVFFSGYGVQLDGDDYLMPIDGDPGKIKETGLAAADLVETLAQLPTDKTVLVLDINRSQGSFSGQAIGRQVMSLAESNGVPLFLSCQPEQYSHETFGVRHGLFTAALLEGLQQKCQTLAEISEYVSQRLPELCEHHWRPIQNPVSLIKDDQRMNAVIPESRLVADVVSQEVAPSETAEAAVGSSDVGAGDVSAGGSSSGGATSTVLAGSGGTLLATAGASRHSGSNVNGSNPDTNGSTLNPDDKRSDANESALAVVKPSAIVSTSKDAPGSAVSGAKLRNWGLAALALLMIGVLLKQPFVRTAWVGLTDRIATLANRPDSEDNTDVADTPVDGSPDEEPVAAVAPGAETSPAESDSTDLESADAGTSEPESDDTIASDTDADSTSEAAEDASAEAEIAETEDETATATETTPNVAAETTDDATSPQTKALLAEANAALEQRQYSEALIILQQVPKDERDSAFAAVLSEARAGAAEAQQYNASLLTDARTSIQPTQASQFSDAIAKARRIQPGEPYYEEAQRDIRSWSQIILDIAEGRATSGNLDGAIAAANVMPYDNSEFRQKAQDRIVFWQQRQNSREIITAAQAIPRSGQASTYQEGIVKLREVPIEHPEYETAQRLADEWSRRIFSIAQARAAQGRRRAAIQAAVLVPAGTTAYEPTQQAIKRWQSEE